MSIRRVMSPDQLNNVAFMGFVWSLLCSTLDDPIGGEGCVGAITEGMGLGVLKEGDTVSPWAAGAYEFERDGFHWSAYIDDHWVWISALPALA